MILSKYRVELGGIRFGELDEATGARWIVSDLKGWLNVGSTGETTQRVFRNGGWRNRAYLAPKGYTLEGTVYTPHGNAPGLLDDLVSAIPLDTEEPMTVRGVHPQDRIAYVRQEGVPDVTIVNDYEGAFSIGLVANDPLKYSAVEHSAGTGLPTTSGGLTVPVSVPFSVDSVTVSGIALAQNLGKAPVYPRVLIFGPVPEARITNTETGEYLSAALSLDSGEYLDLDFARHTAHLNGTASRRGYISGQWFSLAPGNNYLSFTSPAYNPDASLQVLWRDGWK